MKRDNFGGSKTRSCAMPHERHEEMLHGSGGDCSPELCMVEQMNGDRVRWGDVRGGTNTANTKETSMKLKDWEVTIQQIIEESNSETKESGKQRILMGWREKLAKDPHLLQLYQIDEIVREVRNRLKSGSQQPSSNFHARLATANSSVRLSG